MSTTRRARQTGRPVTVVSDAEAQLDTDPDLRWWTICEDHGRLVGHRSRRLAESWAADPMTWCGVCNGTEHDEPEQSLDVRLDDPL